LCHNYFCPRKSPNLPSRDFARNALPIDDLDGHFRRLILPDGLSRCDRDWFAVTRDARRATPCIFKGPACNDVAPSEVSDGDASLAACNALRTQWPPTVTRYAVLATRCAFSERRRSDDPRADKTIMAGLFIKELIILGDLERCLIVAPGSLVEQWRDELKEKFDLTFEIVSRERLETSVTGNPFVERNRLIVRGLSGAGL
jgi:hypothetical protein